MCCSPHKFNLDETVSTLRFASRAKTIRTTVKQNIVRSRKELEQMIERMKHGNSRISPYQFESVNVLCTIAEIAMLKKGGTVKEFSDDQEEQMYASQEQLAALKEEITALKSTLDKLETEKQQVISNLEVESDKFEQYQKASVDKLKFFQSQFDGVCIFELYCDLACVGITPCRFAGMRNTRSL